MFGLAHSHELDIFKRVTSQEFLYSFTKGIFLGVATSWVVINNEDKLSILNNSISVTTSATTSAIIGHSIGNWFNAAKNLIKDWNQ